MINNEHNPIAVRIGNIQDLWLTTRALNPDAKAYVIESSPYDFQLVEGFIRLEASGYGKSSDIIIGFSADYTSPEDFYHTIVESWLSSYEADLKTNPQWDWADFKELKQESSVLKTKNVSDIKGFLIKIITSFKEFIGKDHFLGITLYIPRVSDIDEMNKTLKDLALKLPSDVAFVLPDYNTRQAYKELIHLLKGKACVIKVPDQDFAGACKEIATQGNPQDPHVKYRKCLFDLGEAASKRELEKTLHYGDLLLRISREIGLENLVASSYLVFAGFLIRFSKEKDRCLELLDKGIGIVRAKCPDDTEALQLLLQLINYKATVFSYHKDFSAAIKEFQEAIEIAKEAGLTIETVNEYNFILLIALRKDRRTYLPWVEEAFEYCESLPDEILRIVNVSYIVSTYLEKVRNIAVSKQKEIESRMTELYGEDWQLSSKELTAKLEKEYFTGK